MENKNIEEIEITEAVENKHTEKKGNRLANEKQRKKKRQKEKKENGKKKISKKKILIIIASVLAIIVLIVGIVIGTYIQKADGDLTTAALNLAADVLGEDDPIFILVLGLSEDITAELTDTIILAGYNPDSQKAFMLSIPRDTFIGKNEATAGGYDKINALYQKSPEKTVEAVEKLTGIAIDHYVLVKNTALPELVRAIGEVEFNVPIDMDYDDPTQNLHIHLKAGIQMIDGNEAEQLLRFRHNNNGTSYPKEYGDNDYGRMRTQREFIKAVAAQLLKENTSMANLKQIGTAVFNNITTDMSLTKILAYAPSAVKIDMDGIRMEQLPGISDKINNLWFYRHYNIETYDLVNELLTELELDEKEFKKVYTPTSRVKNTSSSTNKNATNQNKTADNTTTAEGTVEKCLHEDTTSKITREATCLEAGEKELTCQSCGNVEKVEIPAKSHAITTSTTNRADGTKIIVETCANEGCTYKNTKTENPACKHENATSTDLTESTCTSIGTKKFVCDDCGEKFTKTIPKKEHDMQIIQDDENKTVKKCTGCDKTLTENKTPIEDEKTDLPVGSP